MADLFTQRTDDGEKVEGVLHFDGSCNPNPGPAKAAFVLRYGGKIVERTIDLGNGTCNIAEYNALIEGMTAALEAGVTNLEVYGDSQLVIRGVTSRRFSPKNKPHLEALKRQAIALSDRFRNVDFNWVPRSENAEADELSR
jgi:ribonuclease HI